MTLEEQLVSDATDKISRVLYGAIAGDCVTADERKRIAELVQKACDVFYAKGRYDEAKLIESEVRKIARREQS